MSDYAALYPLVPQHFNIRDLARKTSDADQNFHDTLHQRRERGHCGTGLWFFLFFFNPFTQLRPFRHSTVNFLDSQLRYLQYLAFVGWSILINHTKVVMGIYALIDGGIGKVCSNYKDSINKCATVELFRFGIDPFAHQYHMGLNTQKN